MPSVPPTSPSGRFSHNEPVPQRIPHPDPETDQTLRRMMLAMGVPRHLLEPFSEDMMSSYTSAKIDYERLERQMGL